MKLEVFQDLIIAKLDPKYASSYKKKNRAKLEQY